MPFYTIAQIAQILNTQPLVTEGGDTATPIAHLRFDSRRVAFPESSLFFAFEGAQRDGHDFIDEVYQKGVRCFVVSKNIDFQRFKNANFIIVKNTLAAFQAVAAHHRRQFEHIKTIGITGSNGKTIVKEWLYELLKDDFNIIRSPKSWNSQVGVPLSVWGIEAAHNLGIFEAGISRPAEMINLERVIQPTIGILTALGTAHAEGFSSEEEKLFEKLQLFKNVEILICPQKIVNIYPHLFKNIKTITWSVDSKADLQLIGSQYFKNKIILKLKTRRAHFTLDIPFADHASIENILTCCLTLLYLGYTPSVIAERVKHLDVVGMRLELKAAINGCLVVNDAYSADLSALLIALDFIGQQGAGLRRTVILSDILQSGLPPSVLYRKVADLLHDKGISRVFSIGYDISILSDYLNKTIDYQYFKSTIDFLKKIKNSDFQNEIILVKGARVFEFEKIAERLAMKAHKTVLEINLNALVHNLAAYRRQLNDGVKTMVMVKAAAYGNGSEEVARLLEFHNVDYLAVAYADEGIQLRQAGIRLPIMVLNPDEASFDAMHRYNLEPEMYSLNLLRNYIDYVKTQATETESPFKIHIKLDTGMHRLGFEPDDCPSLIQLLKDNSVIRVASIFTHLASSENAEQDDFTHEQVRRFEVMYSSITEGVAYRPMRHVLNSGGITRFKNYQFEMVRLGIGLYGVDSNAAMRHQLQIVQTLKATISQIKNIAPPETIGYGRLGVVQRPSRIATISIGYADGLLRGASCGQFSVWLHGQLAPTVGNVCMDMTMIDVTDIPEAQEGDEVEIFGAFHPVQILAAALKTIPYEVFTTISERVKRVYFQE